MRFKVVAHESKWNKYTVIDTKTNRDYYFQVKCWENETIFGWCDALNKKYRQK